MEGIHMGQSYPVALQLVTQFHMGWSLCSEKKMLKQQKTIVGSKAATVSDHHSGKIYKATLAIQDSLFYVTSI